MRESAHLQREAETQRAGLADTLGQLRQGVTGQAISAEITGVVRDVSLTLAKGLADSARNNPGAALLIGAGLTMMLTKTKGGDVMAVANSAIRAAASAGGSAASTAAGSVGHAVATAASTVADKVKSVGGHASATEGSAASIKADVKGAVSGVANTVSTATDAAAAKVSGAADGAMDRIRRSAHDGMDEAAHLMKEGERHAQELTDEASRLAMDTRQAMARLFEEQPILVAAIGTAIGALLGAALPVSQAEREVLGRTGAQALDAGREVIDKAKGAVGEELKEAQLGEKAGQAATRLVDAMVPVPSKE
jgi:ElaB/YqjD/DUF883 family membrane-anchored ribosome-binding protein